MNNIYFIEDMRVAKSREDIKRENILREEEKRLEERIRADKIRRNSYVPKFEIERVGDELFYSKDLENRVFDMAEEFKKAISGDRVAKSLIKRCKRGKLKISELLDKLLDRFNLEEKYSSIVGGISEGILKVGIGVGVLNGTMNCLTQVAYAQGDLDSVGRTIIEITQPVMRLFASLGYPVTFGMLTAGILLIITGKKSKGLEMIKWASIGYIALQIIPFGLGLLDSIGRALTDALKVGMINISPTIFNGISNVVLK